MELIDLYTERSIGIILEDKEVVDFRDELGLKVAIAEQVKYGSSLIEKLSHPIRVVKANMTLKKLKPIKKEFIELLESNLVQHFDEESGDLITDLENASHTFKPRTVKRYIKTYKEIVKK